MARGSICPTYCTMYRVELPHGVVVNCETIGEVRELLAQFPKLSHLLTRVRRPKRVDPWSELAIALQVIGAAGEAGLPSVNLVEALGLRDTRQIGGKARRWERLLTEAGFDFGAVIQHKLVSQHQRRWFGKEKLEDAAKLALENASPEAEWGRLESIDEETGHQAE